MCPSRSTRPRRGGTARPSLGDHIYSPRARLNALYAMLACAFLFGGGARADIYSLVLLRPLSALFAGYALVTVSREQYARLGFPAWVPILLMALAAIQLTPLPPELWTALPGRGLVAQISRDVGMAGNWRPLTLTPGRTWNTLFALFVPLACFLLVAALAPGDRNRLVWPILAFGLASALLGLAQVVGPDEGPLYLYRITNHGAAVGLFANRNHNAIFLASLIPLLSYIAIDARRANARAPAVLFASVGGTLFIFPLILVNGSRAGAAAAVALLMASAGLWWLYTRKAAAACGTTRTSIERWAGVAVFGGVAALAALTWGLSRSLASERLADQALEDELRVKALPTLVDMAQAYFPVGSGFGSFDLAYKVVEPDTLLMTQFLNQAHNDLLQPLIEGGLASALILLAALAWFIRAGLGSWRAFARSARDRREGPDPALFAWLALGAMLAGSLVDYPLRSPSLMAVSVLLACIIQRSLRASPSSRGAGTSQV